MAESVFAREQQVRIEVQLGELITHAAGVEPDDELGNFEIAVQWGLGNFTMHQFMDTDPAVVSAQVAGLCHKLRVHSQTDKADAMESLVQELTQSRSRFREADMRDVPEVILSMLHCLQRSPVHSTHVPRTLDTIIDSHRLIAEKSHALESESESGDSSEEEPWQSSSSELSMWSEDDAGTGEDELGDSATESPVASVAAIVTEPETRENTLEDIQMDAQDDGMSLRDAEHRVLTSAERGAGDPAQIFHARYSCNFAEIIAENHKTEASFYRPWSYATVTECTIVREAVLMLLGERSDVFHSQRRESDGSIVYTMAKVQVLHLSPSSLRSLSRGLMEIAGLLCDIRSFCARHGGGMQYGTATSSRTTEAFAEAVNQVMEVYARWLMDLENDLCGATSFSKARGRDGSLLRLCAESRRLGEDARAIDAIMRHSRVTGSKYESGSNSSFAAATIRLLDVLYHATQRQDDVTTAHSAAHLPLRLLLHALRPSVHMLDEWLSHGRINDPESEFFLSASADAGLRSEEFWLSGFHFRHPERPGCVPEVFAPAGKSILTCGKSAHLMCGDDGFAVDMVDRRDDLRRIFDAFASTLLEPGGADTARAPFGLLWTRHVVEPVIDRCAQVSRSLVTRCLMTLRLTDHLSAVRGIFFMGSGHAMNEFCVFCFQKLRHQKHWHDYHILNDLIAGVVEEFPGELRMKARVRLGDDDGTRSTAYSLDDIRVQFELPWPLNIVVPEACVEKYNSILNLLMKINRAKYALDSRFRDASLPEGGAAESGAGRTRGGGGADRHAVQILRAELAHFVNNLQHYMMNRVLQHNWIDIGARMSAAEDLGMLRAVHAEYLQRAVDQCFLNKKAQYIIQAILNILDVAADLENPELLDKAAIDALRKKFHQLLKLLMHVLQTIVNQGTDTAHFEDLAMRLNYNMYYMFSGA